MNILLAFDGSEAALQACRLIAAYAGDRKMLRVTLLNVQRPPLRLAPQAGMNDAVLADALRQQGREQLLQAEALLSAQGIESRPLVVIGPPAETLLDAAREQEADVLVIGSGRHGPVGGFAIGSVALRVAPAAHCPVLVVGPDMRLPAALGRTLRVVAPVDGSPESARALGRLAGLEPLLGRLHVDLVHFQPRLTFAATVLPPHDDVLQEWSGRDSDAALAEPVQLLSAAGIPHEVHRRFGSASTEIAAFAAERGAELIAMATRGIGAMHHLLLGSVALSTVRASTVPVALLR